MIITACLSFFDEPPELLYDCVRRLGRVGVDRLVAIDGPYALYPHKSTSSSPESLDALGDAVLDTGINMTLVRVARAWEGNEVGKRQQMLVIAKGAIPRTQQQRDRAERDWLLVVDADHLWESDEDLHRLLILGGSAKNIDFARVSFAEVFEPDGTPIYAPARPLMRARWGLQMGTNHYTYVNGEQFSTFLERPIPNTSAIDLSKYVRVVHSVHDRDPERRARQATYYHGRDTGRIER